MTLRGIGTVLILVFLAGCLAHGRAAKPLPGRIEVFGVAFGAAADYRQLAGVTGTDEPCLHGFERTFEALEVVIGYGFDRRVRKIVTHHPATRIFGVHPGMRGEEGERLLSQAGLVRRAQLRTWWGDGYGITLLMDETGTIAGITVAAD